MFGKRKDAVQWLERGRTLLLQGKGTGAESAFGRVLREQPGNLAALKGLMEAWLLLGKSHHVIEHFDSLSRLQQDRWHELLLIALAIQVGHLKVEGYLEWLRLPSQNPERLVEIRELAAKYTKCGALAMQWVEASLLSYQIEEANHGLRQLRDAEPRVSPRLIAHLYAQRDSLFLKENLDVAEALHRAAQIESPEDRLQSLLPWAKRMMSLAPLQRDVGVAYFEQGQPEVAMRYLNRAVNANPYWVNAWIELGLASMAAWRLVRAKEAMLRAMSLNDSVWIGDLLDELEIKLIESPVLSRMEPALDRLMANDPHGAVEPLQRAMDINDKKLEVHWLMGRAYSEMGELSRSTSYLRDAWQGLTESDNNELRTEVQSLLEESVHARYLQLIADDWADEAVDMLAEILAMDVNIPLLEEDHRLATKIMRGALSAEAVLVYEQGRPNPNELPFESLSHLRKAISMDPAFSEARLAQAILLGEAGDHQVAWDEMVAVREDIDPKELVMFHLAGIAFLLQDLETAEKLWQHCAESTVRPWSHLSAQNILAAHSGADAMITTVAVPNYEQTVQFSRAQDIGIAPSLPSRDDILFEISPSAEMHASTFPLEEAIEQAADAVPKLSHLAPGSDSPDVVAAREELTKNTAEEVLQETEALSEVALFDSHKADKKSSDPAFPFRSGESSMELPSVDPPAPLNDGPIFQITPSAEMDIELPVEQMQQEAKTSVPRLSNVAPTSQSGPSKKSKSSPSWQKYSEPTQAPKEPTSLEESSLEASLPDDGPTQRDTLPFGSSVVSPMSTEGLSVNASQKEESSVDDLFGNSDDLESFLDDAFISLEKPDKK